VTDTGGKSLSAPPCQSPNLPKFHLGTLKFVTKKTVEYSATDECLFGKIIGTTDLITFEGESVDNLKKAFTEAVEDYLVLCKVAGKEPQMAETTVSATNQCTNFFYG
jgi:hypothetical protein